MVPVHRRRSGIVRRQRQPEVSKAVEKHSEMTGATPEVLPDVPDILHAVIRRSGGHQLCQAGGPNAGEGVRIERGLRLNEGSQEPGVEVRLPGGGLDLRSVRCSPREWLRAPPWIAGHSGKGRLMAGLGDLVLDDPVDPCGGNDEGPARGQLEPDAVTLGHGVRDLENPAVDEDGELRPAAHRYEEQEQKEQYEPAFLTNFRREGAEMSSSVSY